MGLASSPADPGDCHVASAQMFANAHKPTLKVIMRTFANCAPAHTQGKGRVVTGAWESGTTHSTAPGGRRRALPGQGQRLPGTRPVGAAVSQNEREWRAVHRSLGPCVRLKTVSASIAATVC